jgi:orotidine-5'-phosphate decarboxylase
MLGKQWDNSKFVCVGLDGDHGKIPQCCYCRASETITIENFICHIVNATKDAVCAYKPNLAFYLAYGADGVRILETIIRFIHDEAPDVPVILDAKFADIGNTNAGYAKFAFEYLGADAVTVNPYLGAEALQPFLDWKDKGIFILGRTSNTSAGEFQDLDLGGSSISQNRFPLYKYLAQRVAKYWNKNGNCGLVVGATCPDELQEVRGLVDDMPILIPGIGAQGGDIEKTVRAGKDSCGQGMIVNSSRGIIYASNGEDFADAARRETLKLNALINQYRN